MKKIGRYEIVEELGRGAMGVVYKASDPTIGRLVAIKLLALPPTPEGGLPGAKEIFLREARAAGRLSHPGIVTVHDALEDPKTQSSYIVMEFVPGQTLEKALFSGPPLSTEKALDLARQVAEALDYAHRQQIIHRDLKPANILLTEDWRAKITDFGIAKLVARENAQRTMAIMGTPAYMSPEQVTGGDIDGSSDLFSLGILLYLMVTGQKPFAGDTTAVMFKIVYQDPAPPSHHKPELNQGHDFLLLRALAKDRKKRYATAREFLEDLDDVQHGRPPRSQSRVPMSELRSGDLTLVASQPMPVAQKLAAAATPKKTPMVRPVVGIVALALAVLLVAGVWIFQNRKESSPAPAATSGQTGVPATSAPATATLASQSAGSTPATPTPLQTKKAMAPGKAKNNPLAAQTAAGNSVAENPPAPVTGSVSPSPPPAAAAPLESTAATPAENTVQLDCQYELAEAKLSVSADGRPLLQETLKGRKQGKLLGLKRGFTGTFSQPIKIPADARELTVRVESEDSSIKYTKSISAAAPGGNSSTLHVTVNRKELRLRW